MWPRISHGICYVALATAFVATTAQAKRDCSALALTEGLRFARKPADLLTALRYALGESRPYFGKRIGLSRAEVESLESYSNASEADIFAAIEAISKNEKGTLQEIYAATRTTADLSPLNPHFSIWFDRELRHASGSREMTVYLQSIGVNPVEVSQVKRYERFPSRAMLALLFPPSSNSVKVMRITRAEFLITMLGNERLDQAALNRWRLTDLPPFHIWFGHRMAVAPLPLKVSQQTMMAWATGGTVPTLKSIPDIAKQLKIDPLFLALMIIGNE